MSCKSPVWLSRDRNDTTERTRRGVFGVKVVSLNPCCPPSHHAAAELSSLACDVFALGGPKTLLIHLRGKAWVFCDAPPNTSLCDQLAHYLPLVTGGKNLVARVVNFQIADYLNVPLAEAVHPANELDDHRYIVRNRKNCYPSVRFTQANALPCRTHVEDKELDIVPRIRPTRNVLVVLLGWREG